MELTPRQAAYVRKRTKHHDLDPSEAGGELNIVPFLDIVTNLILFLLMTGAQVMLVANLDGTFDWDALTTCVARVHSQFPDERQVILSADPNIEYQNILHAMDAVRAQGADELFPDVMLSAGVR